VADKHQVQLGTVQETLFIPLAARARESSRKRPALRDPKAAELVRSIAYDTAKYGRGAGGAITVLRTAIFDSWVRAFLARHPAGTVVEIGTGLNTRFERVDNGQVHWIDLDLPDTIELRGKFFTDTDRRRMVAGSVLDEQWLDTCPKIRSPRRWPASRHGSQEPWSRWTRTRSPPMTASTSWRPGGISRPGGPGRAITRTPWSGSACGWWSPPP
jgi:hypothetical protein